MWDQGVERGTKGYISNIVIEQESRTGWKFNWEQRSWILFETKDGPYCSCLVPRILLRGSRNHKSTFRRFSSWRWLDTGVPIGWRVLFTCKRLNSGGCYRGWWAGCKARARQIGKYEWGIGKPFYAGWSPRARRAPNVHGWTCNINVSHNASHLSIMKLNSLPSFGGVFQKSEMLPWLSSGELTDSGWHVTEPEGDATVDRKSVRTRKCRFA